MNKDGNLDRAVLLAPNVAGNSVVGPIAGTPLRDRCRNLILQVGQPDGRPAVVNYIPWSQLPVQLGVTMATDTCLGQEPVPDFSASGGPIYFSDSLKSVRNTLRYPWEAANWPGQSEGTLVIRIEGSCLRLIGDDRTESNHGAAWQSSDESSTNYLTRENISSSSMLERCGADDCEDKWETTGPVTSKIEQRAPICLNDRPLLLSAPAPAPQQPSMPAPAPKQPPQAAAPPAPQQQQTRPTSDAENQYRPPSPFAPRAECIVPPLPMVDSTAEAEGPFDRMMEMCGGSETEDDGICQKPMRTIQLGSAITASGGELESSYLLLYAVDDCGLWLRELDLHWETDDGAEQAFPRPRDFPYEVRPWALEDLDRGQYFVVPKQADGSFYLDDQDARFAGITFSGGLRIVPIERGRFRVTAVP
jgi:hypothetical protein